MRQYQVSLGTAVSRAFSKYCTFTGRASRSEFWWFALFNFLVAIAVEILTVIIGVGTATSDSGIFLITGIPMVLMSIYNIVILLPSWGLFFRRLHDVGRSGWWWLIGLIPLVGPIVLLVFLCSPSQPFQNRYGMVPNVR